MARPICHSSLNNPKKGQEQPSIFRLLLSFYLRDHLLLFTDFPLQSPHEEVSPGVLLLAVLLPESFKAPY